MLSPDVPASPVSAPIGQTCQRPHAVVIGGGFGGLAAAVRLGARGYRVTVLEKLDAPGGRAYVHRLDGFTFDGGPTLVTVPFLFEELWSLCGRHFKDEIDLRPLTPFYKIRFHDGTEFPYYGDPDAMRAEVARLSPGDVKGYERFLKEAETAYRIGFEQLGHVPFTSFFKTAWALPGLIRLRGHRSVHAHVASHIRDPRLRFVFSFHPLFVGGNPFKVTCVYSLISYLEREYGVHYPIGGIGSLINGLVSLIEGQGNRVRTNAQVERILLDGRRAVGVRLTSGEDVPADVVVSNADSAWTYRHLVPAEARRTWTDRRLERARYSMSVLLWYFGTNRRYDDVGHHTIMLGPRYRGLVDDLFVKKILPDDFSLYLHRPTATDPSMAPDGCDAFYVLAPAPHLESGIDWREAAEPYRRKVARHLSETVLPDLEDHVVTQRLVTPQDFQDRLLSFRGAGFGLEPIFTQSAWFRPRNQSEDIDRLYLVGAGTHPGAGIPGVISSAKVLDTVVPDAKAVLT